MKNSIKLGKNLLETISVALYENPIILFREYVQNSLDAYNEALRDNVKEIADFHVAINIDKAHRKITIVDNGYAISTFEDFQKKMKSIGDSTKSKDRSNYIGFRGIGRISGLPFCKKLEFKCKSKDSNTIFVCEWDGEKYREILDNENDESLVDLIDGIVKLSEQPIDNKDKDKHFFEVILHQYSDEINHTVDNSHTFEDKLTKMLPLKYDKTFKNSKIIIDKYHKFMGEKLSKFMIDVSLNGKKLYKAYKDEHILGSGMIFWELRTKKQADGSPGNKIGILWFTFDKLLKSTQKSKDSCYGVLTRSKNVLMGNNDTFAQVADDSKLYVTTFREMAQSLRAIRGELLINSLTLRDNARRDWFLPDEHSLDLNNIIADFMKRLHNYRYCASKYFGNNPSRNKEDLKKILDELINIEDNEINYNYFYAREPEKPTEDIKIVQFSEEDVPRENHTFKKHYDIIMNIVEKFFKANKKRGDFLKLRAYIANNFKKIL